MNEFRKKQNIKLIKFLTMWLLLKSCDFMTFINMFVFATIVIDIINDSYHDLQQGNIRNMTSISKYFTSFSFSWVLLFKDNLVYYNMNLRALATVSISYDKTVPKVIKRSGNTATSHLYNKVQRGKHEQPDDQTGCKQTNKQFIQIIESTLFGGQT